MSYCGVIFNKKTKGAKLRDPNILYQLSWTSSKQYFVTDFSKPCLHKSSCWNNCTVKFPQNGVLFNNIVGCNLVNIEFFQDSFLTEQPQATPFVCSGDLR